MSSNKKQVKFNTNTMIIHYEYDRNQEYIDKKGKDWQRTHDLRYREFHIPVEKGGCGNNWNVFEKKIDELEEPDWCLVGGLWNKLYPMCKRNEEINEDNSELETESETKSNTAK